MRTVLHLESLALQQGRSMYSSCTPGWELTAGPLLSDSCCSQACLQKMHASKSATEPFASVCITRHAFQRGPELMVQLNCACIRNSGPASCANTFYARLHWMLEEGWLRCIETLNRTHLCLYCLQDFSSFQFLNFSFCFASYGVAALPSCSISLSTPGEIQQCPDAWEALRQFWVVLHNCHRLALFYRIHGLFSLSWSPSANLTGSVDPRG